MRHVILQATLLLVLLPSATHAGYSSKEVIQAVKRTAPSVSWDPTSMFMVTSMVMEGQTQQ